MSQITTKQIVALRNFKVPEDKIQALTLEQASAMLDDLIQKARSGGNPKPKPARAGVDRITLVRDNLGDAGQIVMNYFGMKDKSELTEAHIVLIQEMARQVYGLKYWYEKSSTRPD